VKQSSGGEVEERNYVDGRYRSKGPIFGSIHGMS